MSLLDEAFSLQQKPGTPCRVEQIRNDDPALYAEIVETLQSSVHATAISRALEKRGVEIGADVLSRHRRSECQRCR